MIRLLTLISEKLLFWTARNRNTDFGLLLTRLIPLAVAVMIVLFMSDFAVYKGLSDQQSMDNAQLARQLARGRGFNTEFIRPHAVAQLRDFATAQSLRTGKPVDFFLGATPDGMRLIPDTYNAPVYPCLLAGFFLVVHPEFDQTPDEIGKHRMYSADRMIPFFNQAFLLLTAALVFVLGRRLFDERVAWTSLIAFLVSDVIWGYSITGQSTTLLMFLITAVLLCMVEIFAVGEACFDSEERSFAPAWLWMLLAGVLLGAAVLTREHVIGLLAPLCLFLALMPQANFMMIPALCAIVAGLIAPWVVHMQHVCGNPIGSNAPYMLFGEHGYEGNQIFCTLTIPNYERLFKDASHKEVLGFQYHFQHAWSLIGSAPLAAFFGVSLLHYFKRRRARLFHWLIVACAVTLIAFNNLAVTSPDQIGAWNVLILLLPCMLVMGCAFFFIMLDRLSLQLWLLNNLIVSAMLVLSALPLIITLTVPTERIFAWPPYAPPVIKSYAQLAASNEWVTSDMPWATAWYGDRASLWLPDKIEDFENLHDNVCPTGILLMTPVTWSMPMTTIMNGEEKEWFPFMASHQLPSGLASQLLPSAFPLTIHTATAPGGPDYSMWSNRPRWNGY